MKIFCNLEWIVYKIVFLWETWIQHGEKSRLLHELLQLLKWHFQLSLHSVHWVSTPPPPPFQKKRKQQQHPLFLAKPPTPKSF